jgi:cytochrome b
MLLAASLPLRAQETNCAIDPHNPSCGFDDTLHFLHILIAILSVILVVTIAAAVAAYRRMQRKKLIP